MDGMTRLPLGGTRVAVPKPMLGGSSPVTDSTGYPWVDGDILYAADLNAAIGARGAVATDFGIICDGVTDQGAALNAALASMAPGSELYIPGSIYTSVTIQVLNSVRLRMPPGQQTRPGGGSNPVVTMPAIIGSASLSPVVLVRGNEGGLTNVCIGRNGTPASGATGLAVFGSSSIFTHVTTWNHAIGLQVGAPVSAPIMGFSTAIITRFDHCIFSNCTENFVYLINSPETTFYDCRWQYNGGTWPVATSCVTIDGDNNTTSGAGTANTITFLRCQYNQGGTAALYTIRFLNYASPDGWITMIGCYSDGAANAVLYVDPGCGVVRNMNFLHNLISFPSTSALISDTGAKLTSFMMLGNHIAGGPTAPSPGLYLSGIASAQIIGNMFNGPFAVQLDSMGDGVFSGNNANTQMFTGTYTGNFCVTNNAHANLTQTATGGIYYAEPSANYGQQLTLGRTGQSGRVDFKRGTDGILQAWCGINGALGAGFLDLTNNSGSPWVRLNANNSGGICSFMVNTVEVGRFDVNGCGISKVTAAPVAPGAGFAKLAFVAGTTAGTDKLVAYCGTSATPVTIMDNIGAGF